MYATARIPAARAAYAPSEGRYGRGATKSTRGDALTCSRRALRRAMNSGDGSIGGRLRTRRRLRRIDVSCREHRTHVARCCCIAAISAEGRTSSTNITWFSRNARQSIGRSDSSTRQRFVRSVGTRWDMGGSRITRGSARCEPSPLQKNRRGRLASPVLSISLLFSRSSVR